MTWRFLEKSLSQQSERGKETRKQWLCSETKHDDTKHHDTKHNETSKSKHSQSKTEKQVHAVSG
jgi:hypothetical protein